MLRRLALCSCLVLVLAGCSTGVEESSVTPPAQTSSTTPRTSSSDGSVIPQVETTPEPTESRASAPIDDGSVKTISVGDNLVVTVPSAYTFNQDPQYDVGRSILWPGGWDGRPSLDIWEDTYLLMYAMPGGLLSDEGFNWLIAQETHPKVGAEACSSQPLDMPVPGAERSVTFAIDCVDRVDGGAGNVIATFARGGGHLYYIEAFSGTGPDTSQEVSPQAIKDFYVGMNLTLDP